MSYSEARGQPMLVVIPWGWTRARSRVKVDSHPADGGACRHKGSRGALGRGLWSLSEGAAAGASRGRHPVCL